MTNCGGDYLKFLQHKLQKVEDDMNFNREKKRLVGEFVKVEDEALEALNLTRKYFTSSPYIDPKDCIQRTFNTEKKAVPSETLVTAVSLFENRERCLKMLQKYKKDSIWEIAAELEDFSGLKQEIPFTEKITIDWNEVSKQFFSNRTGQELMIQYTNCDCPEINQKKWTENERKLLMSLAQEEERPNWIQISKKIEGRPPLECMKAYARHKRKHRKIVPWTNIEDKRIRFLVLNYGEEDWRSIAHGMGQTERTPEQCWHRWNKAAKPTIALGKWSEEEDFRLILAKKYYQNGDSKSRNWEDIVKLLPSRTGVKVRERWVSVLDPEKKNSSWTDLDLKNLHEAAQEIGVGRWSRIAKKLFCKFTARQCRLKYMRMMRSEKNKPSKGKEKKPAKRKVSKKRKVNKKSKKPASTKRKALKKRPVKKNAVKKSSKRKVAKRKAVKRQLSKKRKTKSLQKARSGKENAAKKGSKRKTKKSQKVRKNKRRKTLGSRSQNVLKQT